MTRDEIVDAIHVTLRDRMELPHLEGFHPDARLNEDLYLDSVLIMQLFLNLELDCGLMAPEEAISRQDVATVADFAALFEVDAEDTEASTEQAGAAPAGVHGEDYVDINVHCVVSCLCHALKQAPGIDHRPFYFSVWDADFSVSEMFALAYHSAGIEHGFFLSWYHRLYGVEVREWFDKRRSKLDNLSTLLHLLETRQPTQSVMVMLDMFHLPERENKFNQNPFPHYLMLETTADPAVWRVLDPDFRWEGEIAREKVINAILQPTVAGGLTFDRADVRVPRDDDLAAYFEACFQPDANRLTDAVRRIVTAHLDGKGGVRLADLGEALRELPVILIRKYAYEHGFAFFWRAMKLPDAEFDVWCDEIETLIREFRAVHYLVMKLAKTGDREIGPALMEKLVGLNAIEFRIKAKMAELFGLWCAARGLGERHDRGQLRMGAGR